ncbi:glutaminyl-peptide cyclotransferase isoform X2 [Episyrphus balteatus]|uniref:glutaminyl-peptide cyclotransferase isoform X2 n=1 Tax=Episyrphus balteatus TaxID=286459 RepID=UPI002485E70F|nr:glutaminyl-peptide cyclotransferase isoform X2 [Episyrphus balteatus]
MAIFLFFLHITITILVSITASDDVFSTYVGRKQIQYETMDMSDKEFGKFSQLSNTTHLREAVNKILIPRVVGTEGHKKVRNYIVKSLEDLNWSVAIDSFDDVAPIKGKLTFHNIIATFNPNAERYLVLACHYDSKYMPDYEFLGATDSAVPCAMLLNMATVMKEHLNIFRNQKLSLMFIFFDGEEAFKEWGPTDSIYGARHLAKKWKTEKLLDRIDMLMLLDLLGAPDPKFYSCFQNTENWYAKLTIIEDRLSEAGLMERYSSSGMTQQGESHNQYFQPHSLKTLIEDDHVPFLNLGVPIVHLIPIPFPNVWHTKDDNMTIIDYTTTENINRILRIFVMEYLLSYEDDDDYGDVNE